eukprot:Gregarina_sp_Poly_1__10641@NODE_79_length_15751_cov_81_561464_g67_i0_p3_GENE_NODE_79_length_15751_cov_81_561464_g67_i0NODE_79_length_15751_cov_81_561464_g67_i0_p3_ORF_typecomplete_len662_score75_13HVSL/PF09749_9/0_22HVSL/PF09749_9/7e03_NODE_79_length_15751_cov_81_561464_g67_i042186203
MAESESGISSVALPGALGLLNVASLTSLVSTLPLVGVSSHVMDLTVESKTANASDGSVSILIRAPPRLPLLPERVIRILMACHYIAQRVRLKELDTASCVHVSLVWNATTSRLLTRISERLDAAVQEVESYQKYREGNSDHSLHPAILESLSLSKQTLNVIAFSFVQNFKTVKAHKQRLTLDTLTAPLTNTPQKANQLALPANGGTTPAIKLPTHKRRRPSQALLGQRVSGKIAQENRVEQAQDVDMHKKELLAATDHKLMEQLPSYVSDAIQTILGKKILFLGRFIHAPKHVNSLTFELAIKLLGGCLKQPQRTRLFDWMQESIAVVVLSGFLFEDYADLCNLNKIKFMDRGLAPPEVYLFITNAFNAARCRSYQWYYDLTRLLSHSTQFVNSDIEEFFFGSPANSLLKSLPWTNSDLYDPLYLKVFNEGLPTQMEAAKMTFSAQQPSRAFFILPFNINDPLFSSLQDTHQDMPEVFHIVAPEMMSRFVRSPTRNMLQDSRMAVIVLGQLLETLESNPRLLSKVTLFILLPIGLCNEGVDLSKESFHFRNQALQLLRHIRNAFPASARFEVQLVSSTWIEDGWFFGYPAEADLYLVDASQFTVCHLTPCEVLALPAPQSERKRLHSPDGVAEQEENLSKIRKVTVATEPSLVCFTPESES